MGLYKGIYGLGFTKIRSTVLWGLIGSLSNWKLPIERNGYKELQESVRVEVTMD